MWFWPQCAKIYGFSLDKELGICMITPSNTEEPYNRTVRENDMESIPL